MSEPETISEIFFEQYCKDNNIAFNKLPCEKNRTPDYDIYIGDSRIVVEVKQIDPNKDDKKAEKELFEGKGAVISSSPGHRVRKKITDAAPQISGRAKGKFPSLLVLYNNVIVANYTNSYCIRTAMYGYEALVLSVPKDPSRKIEAVDRKFGPKRKVTPTSNTSLSAVAVVSKIENEITMEIYHNIYADIPLNIDLLVNKNTSHFTLEDRTKGEYQEWRCL